MRPSMTAWLSASTQCRSSKVMTTGRVRLSRRRTALTALAVAARRWDCASRSQAASPVGTSSKASSAGRTGRRPSSSASSRPVTFSRTWRTSSRGSMPK